MPAFNDRIAGAFAVPNKISSSADFAPSDSAGGRPVASAKIVAPSAYKSDDASAGPPSRMRNGSQ
jgi:hypothetical protein